MIQKVYFRKNNIHPINSPRLDKCSPTSNSPISSSSLSSLLSNSQTDLYNLSIDSQSPIYNNKNLSPNFSINKDKNVEFFNKKIINGYEFNQYLPNDGAFVAKECKTIYKPQNENSVNIIESCYKDIIFRNNFTIFRSKKQISTYSNKITKGFEDAIYYNELGDETEQNPYSNIGNETNVKCANCYISYNKETNIAVIYTNPSFLNGVLEYNKKEINKS